MLLVRRLPSPSSSRRWLSNTAAPILSIPRADVFRFGAATSRSTPVLHSVEWRIQQDEAWAVVGAGSGEKAALFDLLNGHLRVHPSPGPEGIFPALPADPYTSIAFVSFANRHTPSGAFYDVSARYGAVRDEDRYTLRQTMFPETIQDLKSRSRVAVDHDRLDMALFDDLVGKMGLRDLLDLPRVVLSNGQTRRARILKALINKPKLLLLDEPLTGLDVGNRATMLDLLHSLHAQNAPHVLLGLRTQDAIPDWVTHLALVDGGTLQTGKKDDMLSLKDRMQKSATPEALSGVETKKQGDPVVEMKNVNVAYGPRKVLKDINWTICKGQRYHLRGANGSGKTTLLALLTGDHPQSYTQRPPAATLSLFGTPRHKLATPSIHSRIGILTPELFDAFPRRSPGMTVREVIGTGFEGGYVGSRDWAGLGLSDAEVQKRTRRVDDVLDALGPNAWDPTGSYPTETFASARFPSLPIAQQRMVLLMRALVGQHPLVLLDEVWSGMDSAFVRAARRYLRSEEGIGRDQAVIVVTHVEEEVPWGDGEVVRVEIRDGVLSVRE
ncbi:p-loop containing nucleoside triphosphate hydrolase protein [Mycena chlorophos]|uniref:p-loop containing nucleoside triphosphate hydrolase protein n=1 Tax=Mycena chlorophos TaxID=658473 RepID=A0A8H6S418_MYCCL|nr:p-loop containing nucleoside triphosphate hydrolase protein [Mycena chlorophos]